MSSILSSLFLETTPPQVAAKEILQKNISVAVLQPQIKKLQLDPFGDMVLSEIEFYINQALAKESAKTPMSLAQLETKPFFSLPFYLSSYGFYALSSIKVESVNWTWEKAQLDFCLEIMEKSQKECNEKETYHHLAKIFETLKGVSYSDKKLYAASYAPKRALNLAVLCLHFNTQTCDFIMESEDWARHIRTQTPEAKKAYLIFKNIFISLGHILNYTARENTLKSTVIPDLQKAIRLEDFLALDYVLEKIQWSKDQFWEALSQASYPALSDELKNHAFEKTLMEQKKLEAQTPKVASVVALKHKI